MPNIIKRLNSEVMAVSLPILCSSLATTIAGVIMTYIFARIGEAALSASALVYGVMNIFVTLAFGLAMPLAMLVSRKAAENNHKDIKHVFINCAALVLLFGLLPFMLMQHSYRLLMFARQPSGSAKLASQYLIALSYGFFPMLANLVISHLLLGLSKARYSLIVNVIASASAMIFSLLLIPRYGMVGVAYAHNIAYVLTFMASVFVLVCHPKTRSLQLFNGKISYHYFAMLFRLGLPSGLQRLMELVALVMIIFFMGRIGKAALAAQQVVMQIILFFLIIPFSFMQSGSILVAKSQGMSCMTTMRNYARQVSVVSMGFTFLTIIIAWLCMPQFVGLFIKGDSQSLYDLIFILLKIALLTLVFDHLRYVTIGLLRGLGDVTMPMVYSLICIWFIALPLSYVFAFSCDFGAVGVMYGWLCGIIVGTLLILFRFKKLFYE